MSGSLPGPDCPARRGPGARGARALPRDSLPAAPRAFRKRLPKLEATLDRARWPCGWSCIEQRLHGHKCSNLIKTKSRRLSQGSGRAHVRVPCGSRRVGLRVPSPQRPRARARLLPGPGPGRGAGAGAPPAPNPRAGRRWFSPALHKPPLSAPCARRRVDAVGSGRRRAEPGPRQPRHVLRLPRARRGQQLPHVLLQRQDGEGPPLSGAAGPGSRKLAPGPRQLGCAGAGGPRGRTASRALRGPGCAGTGLGRGVLCAAGDGRPRKTRRSLCSCVPAPFLWGLRVWPGVFRVCF